MPSQHTTLTLDAHLLGTRSARLKLPIQAGKLAGWQLIHLPATELDAVSTAPPTPVTAVHDAFTTELYADLWPLPAGRAHEYARTLGEAGDGFSVLQQLTPNATATPTYLFPADLHKLLSAAQGLTSVIDLSGPEWEWANMLAYSSLHFAPPWALATQGSLNGPPSGYWADALPPQGQRILTSVRDAVRRLDQPPVPPPLSAVQRDWSVVLLRSPKATEEGLAELHADGHVLASMSFSLPGSQPHGSHPPARTEYASPAARAYVQSSWSSLDRRAPMTFSKVTNEMLGELALGLELSRQGHQRLWVRGQSGVTRWYPLDGSHTLDFTLSESRALQLERHLRHGDQLRGNEFVFHTQYGWLSPAAYERPNPALPQYHGPRLRLHNPRPYLTPEELNVRVTLLGPLVPSP